LQGEPRLSGNCSFADSNLLTYQDQWQYLAQLNTLPLSALNNLLIKISPNTNHLTEQDVIKPSLPWEVTAKARPIELDNPPSEITITLANHVYFNLNDLPNALAARLRRLASFSNPVFFKTQALRFSTHGIPRFISCARIEQGYLAIPRGCLDDAITLLKDHSIEVKIDDKREVESKLKNITPLIKLRPNQQTAVNIMNKHDTGILHAPTAFGKNSGRYWAD
jgi:hypothetical protein